MRTLMLIVALTVSLGGATNAAARAQRLSWEGLQPSEQRQLKLYWRLPGMMAEERFNHASASQQHAALVESVKPLDDLSRAARDIR